MSLVDFNEWKIKTFFHSVTDIHDSDDQQNKIKKNACGEQNEFFARTDKKQSIKKVIHKKKEEEEKNRPSSKHDVNLISLEAKYDLVVLFQIK